MWLLILEHSPCEKRPLVSSGYLQIVDDVIKMTGNNGTQSIDNESFQEVTVLHHLAIPSIEFI